MSKKIWLPMYPRNVIVTWPLIRPYHRHTNWNNSINRYGIPNATQGFTWQEIVWPPGHLKRKNNKVESSSTLLLMSTPTWISEKELERVKQRTRISSWQKKKIHSGGHSCGGEKMRNASGQQGENERQGRVKTNRNTSNKIFGEHIRQFLHKNKV